MELRLDSNGLVDLQFARRAQVGGLIQLGYGPDDTLIQDSSVPLARDLNYVLEEVRDNYRPLKWASILPTVSVPDWAERWEISKIVGTGTIKPSSDIGPNDNVFLNDVDRETTTGRMLEFVNGYQYYNRELIRFNRLGMSIPTERAMAQAQAADTLLDQIGATGDPYGLGLGGLGNNSDLASALVSVSGKTGANDSWKDAVSADYGLVLDDLHNLTDAVHVASNERRMADTIVMPLDEFNALNRLRPAAFHANVLMVFQEEWNRKLGRPGRIMVWDRFKDIGTVSSGPRVVAFDSSDVNVAAMMVGKPYGVDQVLEIERGFKAVASMVCGGVRILDQSGIRYMDLHPGA